MKDSASITTFQLKPRLILERMQRCLNFVSTCMCDPASFITIQSLQLILKTRLTFETRVLSEQFNLNPSLPWRSADMWLLLEHSNLSLARILHIQLVFDIKLLIEQNSDFYLRHNLYVWPGFFYNNSIIPNLHWRPGLYMRPGFYQNNSIWTPAYLGGLLVLSK